MEMKSQNIKMGGGRGAVEKAMLRRKYLALDACTGNEERSQMIDLSFHFKKLEEQIKLKLSRRK